MPRFLKPLSALLAVVLALSLAACSAAKPSAAVVDGERVTDAQLAKDEVLFTFLTGLQKQPCGQKISGETQQSACARFTLSTLIQEALVKHYAAAHDVTVSDATVQGVISQVEQGVGGAAQLTQQLDASGLTMADFTALARRLLLFNEVQKAIGSQNITDAQVQQLYQQQKLQFTQIDAKHILVKTKAEADKIARMVTPKNFGTLAQKYSIDTGSAANGGALGPMPASSLDATFVQAALALKPGQISAPVQTQFGWHIIELVSVTVTPLDQVRDQLIAPLANKAFGDWIQARLAHAAITVNPKYGSLDRSTGQVVPIRSTATTSSAPAAASTASPTPSGVSTSTP